MDDFDENGEPYVYPCPLCLRLDLPGHQCLTAEEFEAFKAHFERLDREAGL